MALLFIAVVCGQTEGAEKVVARELVKPPTLTQDTNSRRQWNLDTLLPLYLKAAHRSAAWDEAATNALARFASIRSTGKAEGEDQDLMRRYCREAVSKGCTDPVVLYLHARFVLRSQNGTTDQVLAEAHKKACEMAQKYPVAPIRLFYLALRASEALNVLENKKALAPDILFFRQLAAMSLTNALEDPAIPTIEVYEACHEMINALRRSPQQLNECYLLADAVVIRRWSHLAFAHLLQGQFYVNAAWGARGFGYANTVSDEGWRIFREYLVDADAALNKAWKLDPTDSKIATEMLRVELGQGKGRERLDLWFGRAMALDTNLYEACYQKLYYLEPKWHGSAEDMLSFARECVASKKWGGNIPLITVDAHLSLAKYADDTNYWKQTFVWRDVQSAFEKFFTLNPNAVGWRHDYAKYAYQCEQWDVFRKQLPLFTWGTNYTYFGGRETFERMVANAEKRALSLRRN